MKTMQSIMIIILLFCRGYPEVSESLELKSYNNQGCTFDYRVSDSLNLQSIDDSIWIVTQGNLDYEQFIRNIFLPFKLLKVALPTLSKPNVRFIPRKYTSRQTIPVGNLVINPSIEIETVESFRGIPTAVLKINPVLLKNGEISAVCEGVIEVSFREMKPGHQEVAGKVEKEIINAVFDNSQQAMHFRKKEIRKYSKPAQLPSGQWLRMEVDQDAVYRVNAEEILTLLSANSLVSSSLRLFTNITGGRNMVSYKSNPPDNPLIEIPLIVEDGGDGSLNEGDYIYFYGQGPSGFMQDDEGEIVYNQNPYTFNNYYWLCISEEGTTLTPTAVSYSGDMVLGDLTEYEFAYHREIDKINYIESGLFWYEEKLEAPSATKTINISIPDVDLNRDGKISFRIKGGFYKEGSATNHNITLFINDSDVSSYSGSFSNYTYVDPSIIWDKNLIRSGLNRFILRYSCNRSEGGAYFDWFEVHAFRKIKPLNNYLDFWMDDFDGLYNVHIADFSDENAVILRVTDFSNYNLVNPHTVETEKMIFAYEFISGVREHFIVTTPQSMKSVNNLIKIDSPDWVSLRDNSRQADYIIISPDELMSAAGELADYHSNLAPHDKQLRTVVVSLNKIYRQFSGDVKDPHAIRLFLHYTYLNWNSPRPAYVLLFGDGSYDYRGIESLEDNLIPTYQVETTNSGIYLDDIHNRPVDWKYVAFGNSEALLYMALGRLPVRNLKEAQVMVNNIIQYCSSPETGLWRTTISLVADDPNRPNQGETSHTNQSEQLSELFPESYLINKLYLLEYPEVVDASSYGVSKPDATEAILNALNKGTVLINYFGHGGPTIWAQEYVLVKDRDLSSISANGRLPLWVAGTCDWAKYDMIGKQSMGEAVLSESEDAAIGTFAATRKSFGGENYSFISSVIRKYFQGDGVTRMRLGTAVQAAYGGSTNDQKYVLLADPALYLAIPYDELTVTSLSGDTLSSLSRLIFSGELDSSVNMNGYNQSQAFTTIYDAKKLVTREYKIQTSAGTYVRSISYYLPGNRIFNGILNVNNGIFSGSCIIPKDISFSENPGRISVTVWSEDGLDGATGSYEQLFFRGAESVEDQDGPNIEFGVVNRTFREGDKIPQDARIFMRISDPLGINLTGQIGHNLLLKFDDDQRYIYDFTDDFTYDRDSDTSGYIETHLPSLVPGLHQLTVEVWDNANNMSTETYQFYLVSAARAKVFDLYPFPNPFAKETDFTFQLNQTAAVTISVYTVRGRKIRHLECGILEPDFYRIHFDGRDEWGDRIARGVYLYKVKIRDIETGESGIYTGKMIKG